MRHKKEWDIILSEYHSKPTLLWHDIYVYCNCDTTVKIKDDDKYIEIQGIIEQLVAEYFFV